MEKRKPDMRLFLPLLIIPLIAAARLHKRRKAKKEQAAVKELARRVAEERKSGKTKKEKGKGKGGGLLAKKGAAYRNRLIRFVLMLVLERFIAARRAQVEESLPSNNLVRRLSKVKDF